MTRGLELSKTATIAEEEDGSFTVPSQTSHSVSYQVKLLGGVWVCSCPDFETRADQIEMCKHAFAVKFWIASRVEIHAQPKPNVFAEDALQCVKCGSIRVVRFGTYNGKQVFRCKDCKTKFREGLVKKVHYSPETITLTLDLYFSGLSLRKITRTLNNHFDMKTGPTTIYRWIQTYVPLISEYANSLKPQLSETWHADEIFVKMKGGEAAKGGMDRRTQSGMAYLWNVMDRKTRFLLASKLSKYRDVGAADRVMREAMKNAKGSEPEKILTDGLKSYRDAIKLLPMVSPPNHLERVGIKKPHANNNRIERMNGTLRERVKVQRGWKTMQTPLAEGQRIQYNFVKPHMALDGQTPADAAGVGVKGKDKWMSLLKEAITQTGTGREITQ
jgi:transposase-like protein